MSLSKCVRLGKKMLSFPRLKENRPSLLTSSVGSCLTRYEEERNLEHFSFFFHDTLNKISRGNLLCNYSPHTRMSQGRGWIKVGYQRHSALILQPPMPSSRVSLSQINLSRLLYWQAQRRIWQGKPVTYKPRVKPPFLAVFRSSLTATAVEGDIFRNLGREERKLLCWHWLKWRERERKKKKLNVHRQTLIEETEVKHWGLAVNLCVLLMLLISSSVNHRFMTNPA